MRARLAILSIAILSIACKPKDEQRSVDPEDREDRTNGGRPISDAARLPPPRDPECPGVCGVTVHTSSYCGGAVPPQELLDDLATARIYADRPVYARAGDHNEQTRIVARARSDERGRFALKLPPGTYCLFGEDRKTFEMPADTPWGAVDPGCVEQWFAQCEAVVEVPGAEPVVLYTRHGCSSHPCVPSPAYP